MAEKMGKMSLAQLDIFLSQKNFRERKAHNINKLAGLSRESGWVPIFDAFFGSFLLGEKKSHIDKVPPRIPVQSRGNFVDVFFSLCGFFFPKTDSKLTFS